MSWENKIIPILSKHRERLLWSVRHFSLKRTGETKGVLIHTETREPERESREKRRRHEI